MSEDSRVTEPLGREDEPLSIEFRQRLIAAVERSLRVRRAILLLAGRAAGHLPGAASSCRVCHRPWPCESTKDAARSALDAFADTADDPFGGVR